MPFTRNLEPFALERFFAEYEFTARVLFCSSDSETLSVRELLALEPGSEERLLNLTLGYTETLGSPRLREVIASTCAPELGPESVLVHSGAQEAIFSYMSAVLEPGDSVIVQTPCYQSLSEVARARGCKVSKWPLRIENQWRPDLQELKKLVRAGAKLIVINSPHNPTGVHFTRSEVDEIIAIARETGARIFSDEVYRFSEYKSADRLPAFCELYEKATSLGVMSKTFGLAGLRIGWLQSQDREALARAAEIKDYTTICASAPAELLAEIALRNSPKILERNHALVQKNLKAVCAFFEAQNEHFEWLKPQAGVIAFPRFRNLSDAQATQAIEKIIQENGVAVLPGRCYGVSDRYFRIGFGKRKSVDYLDAFAGAIIPALKGLSA